MDIDTPADWAKYETLVYHGCLEKVMPENKSRRGMPKKIELIICDFDGVITDNKVWVDQDGREMVAAYRSDSPRISELRAKGIEVMILSSEPNGVVAARAKGARLLRALDRDESVAQAVQFHHENVDGSGYHGRRGNEIPLAARIVAVAEAYNAMTMSRIREHLRRDEAIAVLEEQKGTRFDTACVDALVASVRSRPRSVPMSPLG